MLSIANTTIQQPVHIEEIRVVSPSTKLTFEKLIENSQEVHKQAASVSIEKLPANKIATIATSKEIQDDILSQACQTRPIIHQRVYNIIKDFLEEKCAAGTSEEKALYTNKGVADMVKRLVTNRPLAFLTRRDHYLLPTGEKGNGGFDEINTSQEKEPLVHNKYISYEEMQLSALIGMSTPVYFINKGHRNNRGIAAKEDSFIRKGIYQALVGARFERAGKMEHQHMIISSTKKTELVSSKIWEKFYNVPCIPSQENVAGSRFHKLSADEYFDLQMYRDRMKVTVETSLFDANRWGQATNQKVYLHVVGLGTGEWAVAKRQQEEILVDLYNTALHEWELAHISDINFSWFNDAIVQCGKAKNGESIQVGVNNVCIHFSERNPADLIPDAKDKLLVAQYAWDSGSGPGNEYWLGMLTASGDPAAAACSTVSEVQNPLINTMAADTTVVLGAPLS